MALKMDSNKVFRERRKKKHLCLICGLPLEEERRGFTVCQLCSERIVLKTRERRARREADGLCPVCGGERKDTDWKLCETCRKKARVNMRRRGK